MSFGPLKYSCVAMIVFLLFVGCTGKPEPIQPTINPTGDVIPTDDPGKPAMSPEAARDPSKSS